MSEVAGPVAYPNEERDFFSSQGKEVSQETLQMIDTEIKKILNAGYHAAKKILTDHADQLELVAKVLLERETLTGEEIDILLTTGTLKEMVAPPKKGIRQKKTKALTKGARASGTLKPQEG